MMVKALSDAAGVDCCCNPPDVLLVCPSADDVKICGVTKTMSVSGIEVRFVDGDGNGCITGWSFSYPVQLFGTASGQWFYPENGTGGWVSTLVATLGNADCSNVGSDGEGSGLVGCGTNPFNQGDPEIKWTLSFAPFGLLAGGQFRYGAPVFPCPSGPWSYGPWSPDPQIVGLAPGANPGIISTGSATLS